MWFSSSGSDCVLSFGGEVDLKNDQESSIL